MNKKIIAGIIILAIVIVGAYELVYVPYQNEQATKNYYAGLQNVSAMDDNLNQSMAELEKMDQSNVSAYIKATQDKLYNEVNPTTDEEIAKLNETIQYSNGNKTKEQFINLQIERLTIEKDGYEKIAKAYTDLSTAFESQDINKVVSASDEIADAINDANGKLKTVCDNIKQLLNDNPDFNKTVHDLNLTDEFYGNMNLTNI